MKNILTICFLLGLLGCAHSPDVPKGPLVEPRWGMSRQQLTSLIGKPDSVEIYQKLDKTRVEFDIYARKYPATEFKLPVCLINEKVVGWGRSYYEDHANQDGMTRIK